MAQVAYIDTSAFVKLFSTEPESEAMNETVARGSILLTASEILSVEAGRAAMRAGGQAQVEVARLLRRVALQPLSLRIRESAQTIGKPSLRTLDAIHLATALSLGEGVGVILTYDQRLAEASAAAGLRVLAPA